jgi:hypothetical protein
VNAAVVEIGIFSDELLILNVPFDNVRNGLTPVLIVFAVTQRIGVVLVPLFTKML